MKYLMLEDRDCGPAVVSAATEIDIGTIKRIWGWRERDSIRADINDSPWRHFDVLSQLGRRWKIRSCGDILTGQCRPEKTIVLIHGRGLLGGLLAQHWVLLAGRTPTGNILCHWGDGKEPRELTPDDLSGYYSRGTPACAYEIDPTSGGQSKLSWFQRLYVRVMGRFA